MLAQHEREHRKMTFAKKSSENTKKYTELYADFCSNGYTPNLAREYADYFVLDAKKPAAGDILQAARLYNKVHDYKTEAVFLEKLEDMTKKLTNEEKFVYCVEGLLNKSKIGNWRDAEDFRTENINFMQNTSQKKSISEQADMYIALALADCAAKRYRDAFKLMKFGYKPQGKNDTKLLDIMITGVYLIARSGETEGLEGAVESAHGCLKLFTEFEYRWSKKDYLSRIDKAAEGII